MSTIPNKGVCSWPRCSCRATGIYCSAKPGPKKHKGIKQVSEKGKLKKIEKKALVKTDMSVYLEIWQEREHRDFETNDPITGKPVISYFHHVLEKRKKDHSYSDYTAYRHSKWNIVIVSKETHNKVEADLDLTPKIKAYKEKLLKLHQAGRLKNYSPEIHEL